MDKVIFNMATFTARIKALEESVPRILPQCDEFNIYLNEFSSIPKFLLNNPKIIVWRSQDYLGDLGDVGKFIACKYWKDAYVFTVDDKLLYPPDYAKTMIECIERYKRKAVVSAHARIFPQDRKLKSYYHDQQEFIGILQGNPIDRFVHEIGTGGMAFHTDTIQPTLEIFKTKNMTDIWMSVWLQQNKIPQVTPARKSRWVKISTRHDDNHSIHATLNKDDRYQTEVINSIEWVIRNVDGTSESPRKIVEENNPYGTHLNMLKFVFKCFSPKTIVEFGMGDFSTGFFLEQPGVKVMSIEMQEKEWFDKCHSKFSKLKNWNGVLAIGPHKYSDLDYPEHVDFAFVDGHLQTRPDCVNFMWNRADIIACHDYECNVYKWERIQIPWNYRKLEFFYGNVKQAIFIKEDLFL